MSINSLKKRKVKTTIMKRANLCYITLLVTSFFFSSCFNDYEIFKSKHYKFSNLDYEYFPEVYKEKGKITEFVNQNNEIVTIKNDSYRIEEEVYEWTLMSNGGIHDELRIKLELIDANLNCKYLDIRIEKTKNNSLFHRIAIPSMNGSSCRDLVFVFDTPEITQYDKIEMTINNRLYKNVLVFETSGSFNDYFSLYQNATIQKIYYDYRYGIIGFDDVVNNLEFRIKN